MALEKLARLIEAGQKMYDRVLPPTTPRHPTRARWDC